jgi:protein kinase A
MSETSESILSADSANLKDFTIIDQPGTQTDHGMIVMVKNKKTQSVYAMITKPKDEKHDFPLLNIQHPFIHNIEYIFKNNFKTHFLMKQIKAHDLSQCLENKKRFSENQAKFIAVQVAMALNYLHGKKIIFGDLKPEKVLVDEDGKFLLFIEK